MKNLLQPSRLVGAGNSVTRALAALPKALSLIPSTGLHGHCMDIIHTHMQIPIHKKAEVFFTKDWLGWLGTKIHCNLRGADIFILFAISD